MNEEFLQRLCKLVTLVGEEKFGSTHEHDCFCSMKTSGRPVVHPDVIEFIEDAVIMALEGTANG